MNAVLLMLIAAGGGPEFGSQGAILEADYAAASVPCKTCAMGGHPKKGHCLKDWCGPMPQTCYNPSFGCYPGTRFMHRHPAFHGYYSRAAYNYRHYFDYPWHAGLHEPTSQFSYNVPEELTAAEPADLQSAERAQAQARGMSGDNASRR